MYADLDQLVLSGKLFNSSPSSSPVRTPSPSETRQWPQPEDGEQYDYSSDAEREKRISNIISAAPQDAPEGSIGMGPGRTGVKGVIRDRAEAQALARSRRSLEISALNAKMEKASLGGKTFLEEEKERELERMMLEGIPEDVMYATNPAAATRNYFGKGKPRFGHLREVGVQNFVSAVEKEERGVWVLVHIYDSSLDRCHTLDSDLSRLARANPDTKFLRSRASALGFASSSRSFLSKPVPRTSIRNASKRIVEDDDDDDDDDDPYTYDEKGASGRSASDDTGDDEDFDSDDADVDVDVLPTLLAYRDGDLVHTWVRVDWEAGTAGIDELLTRHHILKGSGAGLGNCGLPSDDEDLWDSE